MAKCPVETCFAPDTTCALGNLDHRKCSRWTSDEGGSAIASGTDDEQIVLPWTGLALGLTDLSFISGREKPLTIAIAGPESAGKTTLLASWYLLMGRGALLDDQTKFNGSFSLAGWEAIAGSLRWEPGQPPTFPPHTTSRDARTPGLLHVAIRRGNERSRDLVFADAPGAWFQKWSVNAEAADAEGARWLARHADVFLIVADRQALAGPKLGQARNAFQLLAKRIAAERRGQPIALVWAKGDVPMDGAMEKVIREAVTGDMQDAAEFTISVFGKEEESRIGFMSLFEWVIRTRRRGAAFTRHIGTNSDPLFLFGRR